VPLGSWSRYCRARSARTPGDERVTELVQHDAREYTRDEEQASKHSYETVAQQQIGGHQANHSNPNVA
jgi:hypothetical protein